MWNQFWSFWSPKTAMLTIGAALNFEVLGIFDIFQCEIFPKMLNRQFLTIWNLLQLFSRKIMVVGKLLNFHTVEYLVKNPNLAAQVCSVGSLDGQIMYKNRFHNFSRRVFFCRINEANEMIKSENRDSVTFWQVTRWRTQKVFWQ